MAHTLNNTLNFSLETVLLSSSIIQRLPTLALCFCVTMTYILWVVMAWKYIKFIKLKQDSKEKLHQDKAKNVVQHNIYFGRIKIESESNCNTYIPTKKL